MDKIVARVPPNNLEAERTVIGSLLLDKDAILKIVDFLHPQDFYEKKHEIIFEATVNLFRKSRPIDFVTLTEELKATNKIESIGGEVVIAEMTNLVPSASHILHYAKIVKEKATLRSLARAGAEINKSAFDEEMDVKETVEKAEQELFAVTQGEINGGFVHIKDVVSGTFDLVSELQEARKNNNEHLRGVPTGYKNLDDILSGLQNTDLIVLAARPSVGKTAFALNLAQNAAKTGKSVGIFSLEMSKDQLVERMLCSLLGINTHDLRTGNLSEDDFARMGEAMDRLGNMNLYIDDACDVTVTDIRAKARRLQMESGLDMVIVDYIQLMGSGGIGFGMNRVQEVANISRGLKALARELKIPVVALSQLSRGVESRENKLPQLSDLRDSGAIEQDADVVMMMHKPSSYTLREELDPDERDLVTIFIRKHRNGMTGAVRFNFDGGKMQYYERTDTGFDE